MVNIYIGIAFLIVFALIALLSSRLGRVEANLRRPSEKIDAQEFLRELRELHLGRFPKSEEVLDRWEGARELAWIMASERSALRRVLMFSMSFSRGFLADRLHLTPREASEFDAVQDRAGKNVLWPVSDMIVEEWETHTVVFNNSKYLKTIYNQDSHPILLPDTLWEHTFAPGTGESWSVEIVMLENSICCWARGGRFRGKFWCSEAEDEFRLITIPLTAEGLKPFLRPDTCPPDPQYGYKSEPGNRQYAHTDDSAGARWHLRILDNVAELDRSAQAVAFRGHWRVRSATDIT